MKRLDQLTQLTAAQLAQDDIIGIRDQSAGQTKYITVKDLTGAPEFGWVATGESHAYSAWNSTTRIGEITVPTDATTKYQPGNRYRFAQTTGGTKYGIIVSVTATKLYVELPIGTTLNNEAITSPVFSPLDSPFGFDKTEGLWEHEMLLSTGSQASPTINVWYNIGSHLITLGTGKYKIRYEKQLSTTSGAAQASPFVTLSTGNNSETDNTMTGRIYPNMTGVTYLGFVTRGKNVTVANGTTTTYYLNQKVDVGGVTTLDGFNGGSPARLVALSHYL